jgi:hypothetical protein
MGGRAIRIFLAEGTPTGLRTAGAAPEQRRGQGARQLDGVKTMEWRSIDSRVASVLTFRFPRFELALRGARPEVIARAKQIATEPLFHTS